MYEYYKIQVQILCWGHGEFTLRVLHNGNLDRDVLDVTIVSFNIISEISYTFRHEVQEILVQGANPPAASGRSD